MLLQPLADKLREMRFYGLLSGLQEQFENPEYKKLSFEERIGMLVDTEWAQRKERKLNTTQTLICMYLKSLLIFQYPLRVVSG